MIYDVYVQGRFLKSVDTANSMSIVWDMTNNLEHENAEVLVPWFDKTKPKDLLVVPETSADKVVGELKV